MTRYDTLALQVSPEAKSAYFAEYRHVAERELRHVIGDVAVNHRRVGPLEFFDLPAAGLDQETLLRLSFVQGVYGVEGDLLAPIDRAPDFRLHEDFVFGAKFKGKTNERLTQMLINVGLAAIGADSAEGRSLLDPMCGRATTLLWAMRYGFTATGIEQDAKAIDDVWRTLKKWTKVHRQKHTLKDGFIGRKTKTGTGRFLDFTAAGSAMRVIAGDAREAERLVKGKTFDLLVSDLPYGVQHFTGEGTRNPLAVLEACAQAWENCLKKNGAVVLAFNRYQPKREALIAVFEKVGLTAQTFSAEHRMSESIVRDVVIFTR